MRENRVKRAGAGRTTSLRISPPRRRLRQCEATEKVRFRDKREAQDALHRAVAARQLQEAEGHTCRRQERRMYLCESCGGWHLTSQTAEVREARLSNALWGNGDGGGEIVEALTDQHTQWAS